MTFWIVGYVVDHFSNGRFPRSGTADEDNISIDTLMKLKLILGFISFPESLKKSIEAVTTIFFSIFFLIYVLGFFEYSS